MTATLLLFDVDGVLVQPSGYKLALRDTVNYFAARLGFAPVNLSLEDIGVFEACGLTNEWDSAAMCVGALLATVTRTNPSKLTVWQAYTDANDFFQRIHGAIAYPSPLVAPDFRAIAAQVKANNPDDKPVTPITHALLCEMFDSPYLPLLDRLFADIYSIETPTTRVQQTFTLGHERFQHTYGFSAPFESESYLLTHDKPHLTAENRDKIRQWQMHDDHAVTIYTARPGLPANGDILGYAPEAELARELLGFDGSMPLVSGGTMQWLAQQYGRTVANYIKPSPVQALAAIGAAYHGDITAAAQQAASFFEQGNADAELVQSVGRVIVFEDSTGGIVAVRRAVDMLSAAGADIQLEAIGISDEPSKQAALRQVADKVVPDINAALVDILV
jgi:hypothetical protein